MVLELARHDLVSFNAATRLQALNVMQAFLQQVQALRACGELSDAAALELTDIATHIRKGIQRIPADVLYVVGRGTGVDTGMDVVLLKYNAGTGRPLWNLPGRPGAAPDKPGAPAHIAWRYNGPWNYHDRGMSLALNADGKLYLTAMISAPGEDIPIDAWTAKLSVNTYRPALLAHHPLDGDGHFRDTPCSIAVWKDPDTGRNLILRDPVLGDLISISGNAGMISAPNLPTFQYFTLMFDGNLAKRWLRVYDSHARFATGTILGGIVAIESRLPGRCARCASRGLPGEAASYAAWRRSRGPPQGLLLRPSAAPGARVHSAPGRPDHAEPARQSSHRLVAKPLRIGQASIQSVHRQVLLAMTRQQVVTASLAAPAQDAEGIRDTAPHGGSLRLATGGEEVCFPASRERPAEE